MSGAVTPVDGTQSTDPVQQALPDAILRVMITLFQGAINDSTDAFDDNTSDPDAPF